MIYQQALAILKDLLVAERSSCCVFAKKKMLSDLFWLRTICLNASDPVCFFRFSMLKKNDYEDGCEEMVIDTTTEDMVIDTTTGTGASTPSLSGRWR